ncbi:MAG: AAA family ATPase [Candidatus Riflebacteria bacterium]|nr:AAA family ATPase [Candidatus Riflebacteria bacterium]
MNTPVTVTQSRLTDFLLNVAVIRPVFIWGPPGSGKSSIVEQFAATLGLPCVSLLGSQLAPEDILFFKSLFAAEKFEKLSFSASEVPDCFSANRFQGGEHGPQSLVI